MHNNLNGPQGSSNEWRQGTISKDHIVSDSIYRTFLEWKITEMGNTECLPGFKHCKELGVGG